MDDSRILILDGTPHEKSVGRRRIYLGGKEKYLTAEMFRYLVQLAIARTLNPDGSVDGSELDGGSGLWMRYLYRLRKESGLMTKTNHSGRVKLGIDPKQIFYNHRQLATLQDYRITKPITQHESELQPVV